jgi:glycolate oxidase iron-sulfur subunit
MTEDIQVLRTPEYKAKLSKCIHCGLCLHACPTYAVFGTEMDAPRGRIALMRAAAEGRVGPEAMNDVFGRHVLLCLACRSCETACPSGVEYGSLLELARAVVEYNRTQGAFEHLLRWIGTKKLMPNLKLLKLLARGIWLYEVVGLQRLVRSLNFLLPATLRAAEGILPPVHLGFTPLGQSAPPQGERRGRVFFFTGCIQEAFLAQVNKATLRVLQRNGYEVYAPPGQTCCGAAHLHLGDFESAKRLARQNIDAFLSLEDQPDVVICNSGGCGLALKEYPHVLSDDASYARRAVEFSSKVKDVNEFLHEHLNVIPPGRVPVRATYSDSCHLRHGQKVINQPRELLRRIPGLELKELQQPDRCCGSAGVYNIAQVDTANAVLDAKMEDIAGTGAEVIVTSSTGCQMQLIAGVRRAGLTAKVMHVVELLDLSYRATDGNQNPRDEQ